MPLRIRCWFQGVRTNAIIPWTRSVDLPHCHLATGSSGWYTPANMDARDAAAKSYLSIAKRYGSSGHLWVWKDGLGGFRGTGRMSGSGESLCRVLTAEEVEAHEDWEPMMSSDVDPEDRPIRHRHKSGSA